MREKRLREENDARANRSYMNRWVEKADEDNRKRAALDATKKQKLVQNQEYLKEQMHNSQAVSVSVTGIGLDNAQRKKHALGGLMNPEEARMNRALLQEIARVKRGEEPTGLMQNATKNPI